METKEISIPVRVCAFGELCEEDRRLVEKAKEMTRTSHAPYSRFHVGAAVLLANGEVVGGSNQENAAFSAGTCAERSACFYAAARWPGVAFRKIAIAAWTRLRRPVSVPDPACFQADPISPCGVCRQALLEYENAYGPIEVILYGADRTYVLPSVASLLPLCFTQF